MRRLGLNNLEAFEPAEQVRRYEREHPGELSLGMKVTGITTNNGS
jgi:hypothetical protein